MSLQPTKNILLYSKTLLLEQLLKQHKQATPYEYETVSSVDRGMASLALKGKDILVVNITHIQEGLEWVQALEQEQCTVPVLMLGDKAFMTFQSKLPTLRLCVKPISLQQFFAEIERALAVEEIVSLNNYCSLHMSSRSLKIRGELVPLTEKEVALLKYFYDNTGQMVGKAELLEYVWGYGKESDTHTVETHIYRLRQKIGENVILTEGDGYRIDSGIRE